ASDPTSTTSVSLSNKSASAGASATLLLLKQRLVCCIHQLNPPSREVSHHLNQGATKLPLN
ncbi:MAG: hypothetical protein ABI247_08085, partial [Rhodanobacter sp.]